MSLLEVGLSKKANWGSLLRGGLSATGKAFGNAGRAFDKNVYRRGLNAFRNPNAKIPASQWNAYRQANPAMLPAVARLGVLGGLGYGAYRGLNSEGFKDFSDSIGENFDSAGDAIGDALGTAWDNKGAITGVGLPILAFLASRGRVSPNIANRSFNLSQKALTNNRNPIVKYNPNKSFGAQGFQPPPGSSKFLPFLLASGGLGTVGSKLDSINRDAVAEDRARVQKWIDTTQRMNRRYEQEGISRNSPSGTMMSPYEVHQYNQPFLR